MKRYTSIKFILLTIIMLSGSLLLKASSGIGIDASEILSVEGEMRTLNVESHEHIPQPYESLQDLLDDNPDLIIKTSTDLNDIVLTHDRDELDDEDPIYKKYNRYYILKDETNEEYEIKQYIIKKIGVIIVGSGNASVSMYHDNIDPSTYNGGELYDDAVTNQHVYNYFPAGVNLVQNECPGGQLKITYTEKVYGEGNVEERCRTILERTYVIECELLGMTAKYNAVMQYVFLHHNQVIETSGTMETIKTEVENIADVAPYASLSELMAANPGLNVIAKDMHRLKVIYKNDVLSDENECKDTYSRCYEIVDECTTGGDPLDVVKAVVYQNIELNKFSIKIINRFLEPFTYSCEGMPGEAHSNLAHLKNHGLVLDPSVDESDIIVSYHDLEDEVYPYYYTRVFYLKSIKCPEVEESIIQEYKPDFLYCYAEESPDAMYEICSKEDFDATLPKDKASALAYLQHQVAEGWLQQSEFNYLTFNYPPFNGTSGTLTCTSYSEATAEPTDCVNHYWTVIQFNYNYKGRIYKSEWSGLTITYTYEEDLSENYPYKSIKVPNDTVFGCLDVSCLPQPMTAEELDEKYEDIKLPELCSDVSLEMKMNIELMDADGCHKEYKEWYTLKDYCTGLILYEIEHTVVLYDGLDISGTLEPFTYAPCDGTPTDEHANIDYLISQGLVLGPDVDKNNITVTYHDMPDEEYPYYFTRAFFLRSTSCPKAKEEIVLQDYKPDYVYCFDELIPGEEYEICSKEDLDATLPKDKASALAFLQDLVEEEWLYQDEVDELTFNVPPFNEYPGTLTCTSYSVDISSIPGGCEDYYLMIIEFNYDYKGRIYKSEWTGPISTFPYEEGILDKYEHLDIKPDNDTIFGCLEESCLPEPLKTIEEFEEKYKIDLPKLCPDEELLEVTYNKILMNSDDCHKEYNITYKVKSSCSGFVWCDIEQTIVLYNGLDISGTLEPFTYAPCDGTPTDEHANIDYLISQGLVLGPNVDKENITVTYHDMPDEEYPYYFTRAFFIRSTSCPKAKEEIVLQEYKPDYVYCFDELIPGEEYEICSKEDLDATLPKDKASALAFLQDLVEEEWLYQDEVDELTFNVPPFNEYPGTLTCTSYSVDQSSIPGGCEDYYLMIIEFNYDYKGRIYKSEWTGPISTFPYEEGILDKYKHLDIKPDNDTIFGCLEESCLPEPLKTIEEFEEKYKIDLPELCPDEELLEVTYNKTLINSDDCHKDYNITYKVKSSCSGFVWCDIEQTIVLYDGIDVEGSLATYKYNVYDDECHAPDWRPTDAHKNIDYLISQGLVLGPDEDKDDIDVSYVDMDDEKYPYYFTRAFFLKPMSCPKAKEEIVLQEYEPGVVHYYDAWENGDEGYEYVCKDDINSFIPESNYASAVEYINNYPLDTDLTQDDIDEILFNYAPFNEYDGNRSAKVESYTKSQKGGCETELDIEITIYYEYYGRIYESKFFDYLILRHYDKDEYDFDMQTLELPELTIDDCKDTGNGCMPEAMSTIEEFAEQGITIEQICNDDGLLKFEVKDEKTEDGGLDCMDRYTRTYKIYCKCTNHLKYTITQKINIETNLDVYGYMPTIYYEDELPEAYTDLETMMNNGLKYEYSGDLSSLVAYSKDFVMKDVPNRTERRYYLSTSCTDVIDSISQYLVKVSPEWSEFEVMEVNNVSESTFQDGSIVLKTPQDDQLEEGQTVMDAYEIILIDQSNNEYTFEPEAENHLIAKNLPAGTYILEVFPTEFDKKEPIYRFIGKITELKTEVAAVPYMSLAAINFYVLTFGHHYYYGTDPETGTSHIVYIQNDDPDGSQWVDNEFYDWHYYFTTDDGKMLSSVYDGEGFSFVPSIQQVYETNINYWRPGETIQLTMNSNTITFHALHKSGKELTNTRLIYSAAICLSNDPNEIFGPTGYGDDKMISTNDRIDYKIMFENDPELATAAAARVKVTCPLHPHADSTTVRLGQYGFGDYIFDVPPMSNYYNKRLDLADSLGVWLDVTAGIDVDNNEMYWIFQSIDPETGVAPTDTIGFLPVNDTLTGCGEGFVTFSVMSIDGMKTRDTISEQANIIFDENDNILTNTYTNMFDAVAPTSVSVCDSSNVLLDYNLIFKSVATDDENGSGVRQVDLYVNVDSTQYVYVGSMYPDTIGSVDTMSLSYRIGQGSLYQFVLQAVDNVGNKEPFSDTAQISFINNNPPLDIFLSNRFFYEDDEIGTVIGEFTTLDDQTSDAFTYSLVNDEDSDSDKDNDIFIVDGKKLKLNRDLRCYGQYMYQILVKTEDVNGDCFNKAFLLYAEQTMTPPTTLVDHYLCHGDFIEIAGKKITEDGYYYDTIPTVYGCDSIVKHIVKHRPEPVVISYPDEFICMYEDYNSYGFNLTWENIQERLAGWDQLKETTLVIERDSINVYGCIDTVRVDLTVYPASRSVHDVVVCADEMPFIYGDSIFTKAGTKDVYFTSVITGCDSVVTVNLETAPSHYDVPVFATICDNEYYMLFEDTIRVAGTYYKMGESKHHCDSSVYLTLEVLPTSSGFGTLNICASELPYTYGDRTFDESTVSGTYDVVFPAENGCDSIVALDLTVRQNGNQYNSFSASWDWFSTYIDDEGTDVMEELKTGLGQYAEMIKSSTEFITYSSSGGWLGALSEIENEQMYMIKTKELQNTHINGCLADPEEHPINIKKGWNHIGYISQYSSDVNEALEGLDVEPQDGDIIKSYRDGFSVYFDAFNMWFGDLTTLQPGMGYQYMSNNDDDITLTYPQMTQNRTREIAKAELNWSPSYNYPDNMTFIADIVVDDWVCNSDTLEVGAFCNGEKRGNARAIYIKEIGAYRVFLTTYGNNGDELYFMLYDHESQDVVAQVSNQRVEFEVNETFGSLLNPYSFEFNTLYNTLIEDAICFGNTYEENGFNVSAEGSYFNKLKDNNGNDSIVKLKLNINPVYRIEENVLVKQFPYEYDGNWIEEPGVHTFNYTSVHGCDSIMVCSFMYETMELMLTPNPARQTERVLVLSNFTEEDKAGMVVEVFNAVGLKIHSIVPRRFPIELPEIDTSGSYTIRVVTGTGKVLTAKLIVM